MRLLDRVGRFRLSVETRLLLLTIGVSGTVLLLLAQLRFPDRPPQVEAAPAAVASSLEQIARRVGYDELAGSIVSIAPRLSATAVAVRLSRSGAPETNGEGETRFVPGLRLRPELVVAWVDEGFDVQPRTGANGSATVVLRDLPWRLVALRAPEGETARWEARGAAFEGPIYLAAMQAGARGPALHPVFVGRGDLVTDRIWARPVVALASTSDLRHGDYLFTLDGRLLGIAVPGADGMAIAPAAAIAAAVEQRLQPGMATGGTIGADLQELTPSLAIATGVERGVIVRQVDPQGPSAGSLEAGDVLDVIGETVVRSVPQADTLIAALPIGVPVRVAVIRRGERTEVDVQVAPRLPADAPAEAPSGDLGLELRTVRGRGARVLRVAPGGAASRAGVQPGDSVLRAGVQAAPTAADVARHYAAIPAGGALLVVIERSGRQLVLAFERP